MVGRRLGNQAVMVLFREPDQLCVRDHNFASKLADCNLLVLYAMVQTAFANPKAVARFGACIQQLLNVGKL